MQIKTLKWLITSVNFLLYCALNINSLILPTAKAPDEFAYKGLVHVSYISSLANLQIQF